MEGDWDSQKEAFIDRLIDCAEDRIPGLREHIQSDENLILADWRARTYLDRHALGGIKFVLGTWRVPRGTPVDGLWLVGAQSEIGGGTNNVISGSDKTAKLIAQAVPK